MKASKDGELLTRSRTLTVSNDQSTVPDIKSLYSPQTASNLRSGSTSPSASIFKNNSKKLTSPHQKFLTSPKVSNKQKYPDFPNQNESERISPQSISDVLKNVEVSAKTSYHVREQSNNTEDEKIDEKNGGSNRKTPSNLMSRTLYLSNALKSIGNKKEESEEKTEGQYILKRHKTVVAKSEAMINPGVGNRKSSLVAKSPTSKDLKQSLQDEVPLFPKKEKQHSISTTSVISPRISKINKIDLVERKVEDNTHAYKMFFKQKLKSIEEMKQKLLSKKAMTDFYFKIFQETIDHEYKSTLCQVLREIRTGLKDQVTWGEQDISRSHKKEVDGLKEELSNLKLQLGKEQEIHKNLSEKYELAHALKEKNEQEISNFKKEIGKLTSILQKSHSLYSSKAKKSNDLEARIRMLSNKFVSLNERLNKVKAGNKKSLHLLYLMHHKGYPVIELYKSEIKNLPDDKVKSFLLEEEDESLVSEELTSYLQTEDCSFNWKASLEESSISFDQISHCPQQAKHIKQDFIQETSFDDLLLRSAEHSDQDKKELLDPNKDFIKIFEKAIGNRTPLQEDYKRSQKDSLMARSPMPTSNIECLEESWFKFISSNYSSSTGKKRTRSKDAFDGNYNYF